MNDNLTKKPSKKIFRPAPGASKADSLLKVTAEFEKNSRDLELASEKVFARVYKNKVTSFHKNTRTLPIPLERFLQIDWPAIDDLDFYKKIDGILRNEDIHIDYSLESALDFFEGVYMLAIDIDEIGLSQPIALYEPSLGVYELIYGQRRFMASIIAGFEPIDAVIFSFSGVDDVERENLILAIQDSENEQHVQPSFIDRFFAKHEKYLRYEAAGKLIGLKPASVMYLLGVNARDGKSMLDVFKGDETLRERIFELVRRGELSSFRSFRDIDLAKIANSDSPVVAKKESKPKTRGPLYQYGVNIYASSNLSLFSFLLRSLVKSPEISEGLRAHIKSADLNDADVVKSVLIAVASGIKDEEKN